LITNDKLNLFLGVDPGYSTGYCFMDIDTRFVVSSGVLISPSNVHTNVKRYTVAKSLEDLIIAMLKSGNYIVGAAIESQFVHMNPKTSMNLSKTVGGIEYAIYNTVKVPIYEVTPETAKKSIGVKTSAFKKYSQKERHKLLHQAVVDSVEKEFNVKIKGHDDEAFAIAIANAGLNMYEAEFNKAVSMN
jgi:Holliday junction resolvasome RuvABC endonuclease subunit